MKFFQKTGVAVAITVLAIAAALFIGLSPVLKSGAETAPVQTVSSQDTSAQTSSASLPASESTASGTAGDPHNAGNVCIGHAIFGNRFRTVQIIQIIFLDPVSQQFLYRRRNGQQIGAAFQFSHVVIHIIYRLI